MKLYHYNLNKKVHRKHCEERRNSLHFFSDKLLAHEQCSTAINALNLDKSEILPSDLTRGP